MTLLRRKLCQFRTERMSERDDGEVARLDNGACLDVADRSYRYPGAGRELLLADSRLLPARPQPRGQACGLFRVTAVGASPASPSDHAVSLVKI